MNLLSRAWRFCRGGARRDRVSPNREAEVILHDPLAAMPRNLDDPFHDPAVQEKVGKLIADSCAGAKRPFQH